MRGAKWGCAAVCIALVLSGIPMASSESVGRGASATRAGEELILRVAMQDAISTINPLDSWEGQGWNFVKWMYDHPMYKDPVTKKIVPYITTGTTNSTFNSYFNYDDPKTSLSEELLKSPINKVCTVWYNFTNVKWHDGHQMDIEDILFAFYVAALVPGQSQGLDCLKGDNYSNTHYLFINDIYESPDKKVAALRFYLQHNYTDFFEVTLAPLLLPTHIWASKISGQPSNECRPWFPVNDSREWFPDIAEKWNMTYNGQYYCIGSGPFTFVYWNEAKGEGKLSTWRGHFFQPQPNIDGILFIHYWWDWSAIQDMINDKIDLIASAVPGYYANIIDENIGVVKLPEKGFYYMGFNMRRQSFGYDSNGTDRGMPLRRAIAHCIDKEYIVERLLQGYGKIGNGPVSPAFQEWYNDSLPTYSFDLEAAKELLKGAGYVEPNWNDSTTLGTAQNCWKNPDGSKIGSGADGRIDILTPQGDYDPIRYHTGMKIVGDLIKMGIYEGY